MRGSLHRLAEERSIAFHRAVAQRLREDPSLLQGARERIVAWKASGTLAEPYALAWTKLLEGSLESLLAFLVDEGEEARTLRQVTPFAGVIDPRARWQIWREVRAAWEAQ